MTDSRAPARKVFQLESAIVLLLLVALVVVTVSAEAYLTQRMFAYFAGQSHNFALGLTGTLGKGIYVAEAIAYDTLFYGTVFFILVPAGSVLGLNPLQRNYVVLLICMTLLSSVIFAK